MALFNLTRIKTRGFSSVLLSAAFLVFGFVVYQFYGGQSMSSLQIPVGILVLLLGGDFFLRAGKGNNEKK